jgi:hypothetical protein
LKDQQDQQQQQQQHRDRLCFWMAKLLLINDLCATDWAYDDGSNVLAGA